MPLSVNQTASVEAESREIAGGRPSTATLISGGLAAAGPGAITVYLAFRSGGFFAGAPAIVAVVLGVALMLRIMLAERPFEGFGPTLVCAAVGLGLYTVWTLLSALWSHAPAQAMIEFDRALMYWLALVLFGSFGWTRERLLWAVRLLALGMFIVALLGLITRVLPEVHSLGASLENSRLSYPLSYWNGVGIFTAVAIIITLGLATRREEPPVSRALAAAAMPILVATLYFTFSRGAVLALVIGIPVFIVCAMRRELIPTALAILPPVAVAVLLCLGTGDLSSAHYAGPTGVSEGKTLTWELVGLAVAAAALRTLLIPLDRRLDRIEISAERRRRAWITSAAVIVVAIVVVGVAVDAPSRISSGWDSFTGNKTLKDPRELQDRFTTLSNNGRVVQWETGLDNFARHPLLGSGAGTYGQVWAKEGSAEFRIVNAHSIYFETMSNLGAPGLIFLLVGLFSLLIGLLIRVRGPDQVIYASIFAAALTWMLHAGYDWDWELPATGFFLFSLGATAISARPEGDSKAASWSPPVPTRIVRVAMGIGCLALIVSPALVALSQGYLNSAVRNLQASDCPAATRDALDSIHVLSVRPEPYQVLGFCDSRAGEGELAIQMLQTAVARDPDEWESYYGLALVQAVAEQDPRAAAAKAHELAPHELSTLELVEKFETKDPQKWKRRALRTRLPIL
jgi:O-antigen ligase